MPNGESPEDDFDRFLGEAVRRASEDFETRSLEQQVKQRERQEFLSQFRDVLQNVVRPVFERVTAHDREDFKVSIDERTSPDSLTLLLAVRRGVAGASRFALRYRDDFKKGRVIAEFKHGKSDRYFTSKELRIDEVTGESVQEQVRALIDRTHSF
jgi:hypothetical protein